MRKCYQSFKRLLTGQEGSMAPVAVAATIAMLFIILGVSDTSSRKLVKNRKNPVE